jgi:hypothetical protein
MLRTYPRNSPQAAARIVALAMVADGHISRLELDVLDRWRAHEQLGLSRDALHQVLAELCEDLLEESDRDWAQACRLGAERLMALAAEIDEPDLRVKLLSLCVDVIEADQCLADGEADFLMATLQCWANTPPSLASGSRRLSSRPWC